ncbi:hypothetical protein ACFFJX_00170 [Pseudarcicella hirudinis]
MSHIPGNIPESVWQLSDERKHYQEYHGGAQHKITDVAIVFFFFL